MPGGGASVILSAATTIAAFLAAIPSWEGTNAFALAAAAIAIAAAAIAIAATAIALAAAANAITADPGKH